MTSTELHYEVRHLHYGEQLPEGVWPQPDRVDPHYVWVLSDELGRILAVVVAAPAHGTLILLRAWASPLAPTTAMMQLFRQIKKEAPSMGVNTWMVMLSANLEKELKLAKIALRYGGSGHPFIGFIYSGGF